MHFDPSFPTLDKSLVPSARANLRASTSIAPPVFAHADPVTAAVAATLSISTTAATVIVKIAVAVALSALSAMLAPKPDKPEGGIRTEVSQTGEKTPAKIIVGYYATAGAHACVPYTTSTVSGKPNNCLNYVLTVSDAPVTAILDDVIIDGREYKITDTVTTHGRRVVDGEFFDGQDASFSLYDGTQTTVDPFMFASYADHSVRPWSNTAVLSNVAYSVGSFYYQDDLFSGMPAIHHVVKGVPLYDPRKDSSVGGVGGQRWNSKSTWSFSDNPVVIVYNLLRGYTMPDGSVYGVGAPASALPLDRWIAAMNVCDEPGTQPSSNDWRDDLKRYRAGYEISLDQEPLDVIDEILKSCGGMIGEMGGVYRVSVGPAPAPVAAIIDDDIIYTAPIESTTIQPLADCVNTIRAMFPDPAKMWESVEAKPFSKQEWITEDQGLELVADLRLDAVPYPRQVRRLMREAASDHRRRRVHTITLPPKYLYLNLFDQISWTSPGRYYENKIFEIQGTSIDPATLNVTLNLRERNPADYDLDAVADAFVPVYPDVTPVRPTVEGVAGYDFTAITLKDGGGVARKPALRLSWDGDNDWTSLSYQIKVAATGEIVKNGSTTATEIGQVIVSEGVLPITQYSARVKIKERGLKSTWSDWITVTTADVRLTPADIADATWSTMSDIAAGAGITTVSSLPATGSKVGQIVILVPPGTLYRWTGSAWSQNIYGGIPDGAIDATKFAAGIEPVKIVTGSLPTTNVGRVIYYNNVVYRWSGTAYTKSTDATDIVGRLVAGQIAAGAVGAEQLAAGAVSTRHLLVSDLQNLLPNGSMGEEGAVVEDYWVGSTGATISYLPRAAFPSLSTSGLYSFLLQKSVLSDSVNAIGKQYIPVSSGDKLNVVARWRNNNGVTATAGCFVRLVWYDANKEPLASPVYTNAVGDAAIPANWTTASVEITVPAGAAFARTQVFSHANNSVANNLIFDYITIRRKNGGELIVDGSITTEHLTANCVTANNIASRTITASECAVGLIAAGSALIADAAIGSAMIGNAAITSAKIANTIQSDNYSAGSTGWRIQRSGAAEFNGVVVSRQLQIATGTAAIDWTYSSSNPLNGRSMWIDTGVAVQAWTELKRTYLATAGMSGGVTGSSDSFWGWDASVVSMTPFYGTPTIRLFVTLRGGGISSITGNLRWRLYEVT